nr:MFS transporter [Microbacterium agarici]
MATTAFVIVATEFAPTAVLPAVAADFNVPLGATGMMTAIPGLIAALTAPLAMRIPASWDRRFVLASAGFLTVGANALVVAGQAFPVVLLGRVSAGLALGMFWTVGAAAAVRLVGDAHGVRAISIVSGGTSLGLVAGMPAGSLVGPPENWRAVFVVFAVAALAATFLLAALLPRLQGDTTAHHDRLAQAPVRKALARPVVLWGLVTAFTVFVGQFASSTFLGAFLGTSVALPALLTAVLTVFGGVGILGMLIASFSFARHAYATLSATIALLTAVIGLVALVSASGSPAAVVVVVVILWGTVWGAVPFGLQTWMLTQAPDNRETVSAALVVAIQLGIGAGSGLGSLALRVSELASGGGEPAYTTIFIVSAVICVVALSLFATGTRSRPGARKASRS